jgi:hypothetical protein
MSDPPDRRAPPVMQVLSGCRGQRASREPMGRLD